MLLAKYVKLKILFFILFSISAVIGKSQTYQNIFDAGYGEECFYLNYCNDGKFIGTGGITAPSVDTQHICLFKTDEWGNLDWFKYYRGNSIAGDSFNVGMMVAQTSDGGFIATGGAMNNSAGNYDAFLLKTDEQGNVEWFKNYGGNLVDWAAAVIQTSDGDYVLLGQTQSFSIDTVPPPPYRRDIYVIKTNSDGDTIWTKIISGGYIDYARPLLETDSGYIIGGTFSGITAFVAQLNKNTGDTLWTKHFRFDYKENSFPNDTTENVSQQIYSINPDTDGGFIMTGKLDQDINEIHDFYIMKTDADFEPLWAKSYALFSITENTSYGQGVYVLPNSSGYIIAGTTYRPGLQQWRDLFLLQTDTLGNIIWSKIYGGEGQEWLYNIVQTNDNGYLIGASTIFSFDSLYDFYFIKTDSLGNSGGCNEYNYDFLQKDLTINVIQGGTISNTNTIVTDVTPFVTVHDYIIDDSLLCGSTNDVKEPAEENDKFLIYPNPVENILEVYFSKNSDFTVSVSDISGKVIFSEKISDDKIFVDVKKYSAGLYFIEVADMDSGDRKVQKFSVAR